MRIPYSWLKDYVDTNLTAKEIASALTMIGHALDKPIYEQNGDFVMDLEDRGNRADTMGIIGIARDLSALTGIKLKYPKEAKIPEVNNEKIKPLIKVESDKVTRWMAVEFRNVKVGPSPEKIQKRLISYGIEIINNVVDITNYVMIETGMPLHAFDTDKIDEIILRPAQKGETLITFEGTQLLFDEEDLVAADSKKPLTLTTAVGGRESGISNSTANILIEAGLYHQPTARHSAIRHNVRNETSARLGKYLHPHYCKIAISRAIELMKEVVGVETENVSFDYYPNKYQMEVVSLNEKRLNLVSGTDIKISEASKILKDLEFVIKKESNVELSVEVPYFRTDITMEDDLIEEILRIKGYETIPSYLPQRPAPPKLIFPELNLENRIKDIMVKIGFNEVISQQIIDINDSRKTEVINEEKVVKLQNSWNKELNILRPEFISPQLKYFTSYAQHAVTPIKIFEIGRTYIKENGQGYDKYKEIRKVAITSDTGFYDLKGVLERLFAELGLDAVSFEKIDFPAFKKQLASKITTKGEDIGKFGELKKSILESFGIDKEVVHAVLYVEKLLKFAKNEVIPTVETSILNFISEDFTFIAGEDDEISKIQERIQSKLTTHDQLTFVGEYHDDKLKSQGKKSITFNIKFATTNPEKTKLSSDKIKLLQ